MLPFTDLHGPVGVAVNSSEDVFVTDTDNNRVLFLSAGATDQTVLPFTALASPTGVAVDSTGDVYVADYRNGRVVELRAGADTPPTVVPFTGLDRPIWVTVRATGDLYVTEATRSYACRATLDVVLPTGHGQPPPTTWNEPYQLP